MYTPSNRGVLVLSLFKLWQSTFKKHAKTSKLQFLWIIPQYCRLPHPRTPTIHDSTNSDTMNPKWHFTFSKFNLGAQNALYIGPECFFNTSLKSVQAFIR